MALVCLDEGVTQSGVHSLAEGPEDRPLLSP